MLKGTIITPKVCRRPCRALPWQSVARQPVGGGRGGAGGGGGTRGRVSDGRIASPIWPN